jgi:hypothetical protein
VCGYFLWLSKRVGGLVHQMVDAMSHDVDVIVWLLRIGAAICVAILYVCGYFCGY